MPRRRSNVFVYFNMPDGASGNTKAQCKLCEKTISGLANSSSNFLIHLKRKHPNVHGEVTKNRKQRDGERYGAKNEKQILITDQLISFIASSLLPLSLVENPEFREFVNLLDPKYQVPSRRHFSTNILRERAAEVEKRVKSDLSEATSVCLIMDMWSSRQMKGFMGVTGHYVLDWTLHSVMLACRRFRGRHTSTNIREAYDEVVAQFGIQNKVSHVITDNAANVTKAFKTSLPGYIMGGTAGKEEMGDDSDLENEEEEMNFGSDVEDLEDIVECGGAVINEGNLETTNLPQKYQRESLGTISIEHEAVMAREDQNGIRGGCCLYRYGSGRDMEPTSLHEPCLEIDVRDASVDPFSGTTKHNRCYAHTLQLVVRDGMKEAEPSLLNATDKVSRIVSYIRASQQATELLEDEKRVQTHCPTRWNSQLESIRSVLNIPPERFMDLECEDLNREERQLLDELCNVLAPFQEATLQVQQEENASASLIIPVTRSLKRKLQEVVTGEQIKIIANRLLDSIDQRLSQYEKNEDYIMAAVLDPRFDIKDFTQSEIHNIMETLVSKASQMNNEQNIVQVETASVQESFVRYMEDTNNKNSKIPRPSFPAFAEVMKYLSDRCECEESDPLDPLEHWRAQEKSFPILSRLAQRYLNIPASSAPVERLFSIAGKIFRPERCSLKDDTFQQLMMIRYNGKLLKQ